MSDKYDYIRYINDRLKKNCADHFNSTLLPVEAGRFADAVNDLLAELEQVNQERDAAIEDLKEVIEHGEGIDFCTYCKHNEEDGQCVHPCNAYAGESGWEWRGVKEE